jgi:tRNA (guanine37-N1)-methyltransferase
MTFHILTLFPEMFDSVLQTSILKRALGQHLLNVDLINFRSFTKDKYRRVDTPPIGGGAGLVLKVQPIRDALASIAHPGKKILLTPRGIPFTQSLAKSLAQESDLTLVCGHYEGFDERIHEDVDMMVSLGDFILTGGELAAMTILDAVARLLPGVIDEASPQEESFEHGLLEYPQYTEPYDIEGQKVPDILYSGHHDAIRKWRLKQSLRLTKTYRPDLFSSLTLSKESHLLLQELDEATEPAWEKLAIQKGKKYIKP